MFNVVVDSCMFFHFIFFIFYNMVIIRTIYVVKFEMKKTFFEQKET